MGLGDRVQFQQAYWWSCPLCSSENFVKGVDVSEEDVRISLGLLGFEQIPEEFQGPWVMAPDAVTCGGCGLEFTELARADEEPPDADDER